MDSLKLVKLLLGIILFLICILRCNAQLYAEACFGLEIYNRCLDTTKICNSKDRNYIYQSTNTAAIATISCPANTQISMNGSIDYVIEDVYETTCFEYRRSCTSSSPCNCCRAPNDVTDLCFSRHTIAGEIVEDCNSGKVTCQFEIPAFMTSAADIGHCALQPGTDIKTKCSLVGNNVGSIDRIGGALEGASQTFWCHARWALVYYECLPLVTQPATTTTSTTTTSTTTTSTTATRTTATRTTATSTTATSTTALNPSTETTTYNETGGIETEKSSSIGLIVGLVTGCVFLLVCVGALIAGILLYRRKQNPSAKNEPEKSIPHPTEYYNVALNTCDAHQSTDYAEIYPNIPPNPKQLEIPMKTPATDIQAGQCVSGQSNDMYENVVMRNIGTQNENVRMVDDSREIYENTSVLPAECENTATTEYYNISMPNTTTDQQSQENTYESTDNVNNKDTVQNVYQTLQRGFDYENLPIESDHDKLKSDCI